MGLTLRYDVTTGNLELDSTYKDLTAIQLKLPEGESFVTDSCIFKDNYFDVCKQDELFKINFNGFNHLEFGQVLPPNDVDLFQSLRIDGATVHGGFDIGTGPHLEVVPEPTCVLLDAVFMVLFMLFTRRKRVSC